MSRRTTPLTLIRYPHGPHRARFSPPSRRARRTPPPRAPDAARSCSIDKRPSGPISKFPATMDVDKEGPVTVRFDSDVEFEVPWEVAGFRLSECLNEPFELVVHLWTPDLWSEPSKLLGVTATLTVERLSL